MHRFLRLLPLLAVALLGCQGAPKTAATADHAADPSTATTTASAPRAIDQLTDQKQVWECPECGMDFDGPGECTMDHVALVATQVSYVCPADNQPVEHAGQCPRCPMDARVRKTAMAAAEPAAGSR